MCQRTVLTVGEKPLHVLTDGPARAATPSAFSGRNVKIHYINQENAGVATSVAYLHYIRPISLNAPEWNVNLHFMPCHLSG